MAITNKYVRVATTSAITDRWSKSTGQTKSNYLHWICRLRFFVQLFLAVLFVAVLGTVLITRSSRQQAVADRDGSWSRFLPLAGNSQPQHYITGTLFGDGGGIGNVLFRMASLYGIGKRVGGRLPYFAEEPKLQLHGLVMRKFQEKAKDLFPELVQLIHIVDPAPTVNFTVVDTGGYTCCKYENFTEKLIGVKKTYVRITSEGFQHYKFFAGYEREVKKLLQCGEGVVKRMSEYAEELLK